MTVLAEETGIDFALDQASEALEFARGIQVELAEAGNRECLWRR